MGYVVLDADSGESAIAMLNSQDARPDVLLADLVLPGMDGLAVASEVRKRWPAVGVIFMSEYSRDVAIRHGMYAEDDRLLQKPFSAAELASELQRVIDKPP